MCPGIKKSEAVFGDHTTRSCIQKVEVADSFRIAKKGFAIAKCDVYRMCRIARASPTYLPVFINLLYLRIGVRNKTYVRVL
jgi:hypothetical protein